MRGPRKYIYDPIHGSIPLAGAVLDSMNHPLLQRLWGIRQTGLAHLVFPGSGHSRLEHSLGAMWVARAMASSLGMDEGAREAVELAGLLHDIGHPPFSHSLEGALVESTGRNHEMWTLDLVRGKVAESFRSHWAREDAPEPPTLPEILERHGIGVKEVTGLLGPRLPVRQRPIGEMLHGTIDADRLDYMERDAHYTGVAHGAIDSNRLLETLRVAGNHLAFAEKGRSAVEGFLVARSLMYASVYYNKTVRVAESMILSALERLPGYPGVAPRLLGMNDGELLGALTASGGRARSIALRIRVRDLYKRAVTLPPTVPHRRIAVRLGRDPILRRQAEDAIAEALDAAPGDVLIDTIAGPSTPDDDVTIVDRNRTYRLLAEDPPLAHLVHRSPTRWCVALYGIPRLRGDLERRGERLLTDAL